jgi:hypothetical protein
MSRYDAFFRFKPVSTSQEVLAAADRAAAAARRALDAARAARIVHAQLLGALEVRR